MAESNRLVAGEKGNDANEVAGGITKPEALPEGFAKMQTTRYLELDKQLRELLNARDEMLNTLKNIDAIIATLDKQRAAEMK
ncbi:MAG: hypothetical protein JRN62_03685 [Nitrososphaerota archaeon]|jgi:hypothetical protein|nr:hypothetical protein [Nitrososphaerota archaeon]MDG6948703.1 hypothetical protein [Nitrososphaerota archaeon]